MKKLLSCLVMSVALVSCASDKGDVVQPPKPIKKTKGNDDQNLIAETCAIFKGKYTRAATETAPLTTIELDTKKDEAGKYSYSFDGGKNYILADGTLQKSEENGVKFEHQLSCTKEVVEGTVKEGDKAPQTAKYTVVDAKSVKLETTAAPTANGVYVKE